MNVELSNTTWPGSGRIALLYALVGLIATIANLAVQMAVIAWWSGSYRVELSIALGTAAGLPLKYVLEKRWIFDFRAASLGRDARLFALYTFLGIFTTALFWGVEYGFHFVFRTDEMRYLGGAIGLSLGYWVKYHLDRRFVFVNPRDGISR